MPARANVLPFLVLSLLAASCSRTEPVDEITVSTSNVEVSDTQPEFAITDWPMWRGPSGDGTATDQEFPTSWSETENVHWVADIPGRGHSSPIVVGELVLLATALNSEQKQLVIAYDRTSGQQRWQTVVHEGGFPDEGDLHSKSSNANCTVACDGKQIYAAFLNSEKIIATALDMTGTIVWQQELGTFDSKFGYAPSPTFYGSLIVFAADHRSGGYLAAVDRTSGEIAWRKSRPAISSYSSPFVAEVGGQYQLLMNGCGMVASYDPATGEQLWNYEDTPDATCGTIVTRGDFVFAAGGYPQRGMYAINNDSGDLAWNNGIKLYEPSLVIAGDLLLAVNDEGIAYCWGADSGEQRWRKRLGGNFSASPVVCGDLIVAANLSGETFVFEANAEAYRQVAVNTLGDDAYASPAVCGGQVFLRVGHREGDRRRERLYCIGAPSDGV